MKRNASKWWESEEMQAHGPVASLAVLLRNQQMHRRGDNNILRALYQAKGYSDVLYGDNMASLGEGCLSYNLIRTAIDTAQALIGNGKPKPTFATTGGTWGQQRRAKRLDRFVYGAMHADGFYRTASRVFRDAALEDLGALKGVVVNGKIRLVRVDPNEVLVDSADAYYGEPSTLLHSYVMAREDAHALVDARFEGTEAENLHILVERAAASSEWQLRMRRNTTMGDVVEVNEVWRPSRGEGDPGRHVLALSNCTLVDEGCGFFPWAFCRLLPALTGFYGQGLGELLVRHQQGLNYTLDRMWNILRKMTLSRYFVKPGQELNMNHVGTAEDAIVIEGESPPQILAANAIPTEMWRMVDELIRRGLEQVGLNEMSVSARKPAGLDSGAAIREASDQQSGRLLPYHTAFEDFILDTGRLVVNLARQAAADGEKLTALAPMGRGFQRIDWKAAVMDEEEYTLQVFSTASLPTRPEARRQYVEELFRSGQVDSAEYRRLLDMPDVDAANDLALAARDVVDMTLESFLDGDDDGDDVAYVAPEPMDDLAYAVSRGMQTYHHARLAKAPEGRLALVRRYVVDAQNLLAMAQPPPAPDAQRLDATAPTLAAA